MLSVEVRGKVFDLRSAYRATSSDTCSVRSCREHEFDNKFIKQFTSCVRACYAEERDRKMNVCIPAMLSSQECLSRTCRRLATAACATCRRTATPHTGARPAIAAPSTSPVYTGSTPVKSRCPTTIPRGTTVNISSQNYTEFTQ